MFRLFTNSLFSKPPTTEEEQPLLEKIVIETNQSHIPSWLTKIDDCIGQLERAKLDDIKRYHIKWTSILTGGLLLSATAIGNFAFLMARAHLDQEATDSSNKWYDYFGPNANCLTCIVGHGCTYTLNCMGTSMDNDEHCEYLLEKACQDRLALQNWDDEHVGWQAAIAGTIVPGLAGGFLLIHYGINHCCQKPEKNVAELLKSEELEKLKITLEELKLNDKVNLETEKVDEIIAKLIEAKKERQENNKRMATFLALRKRPESTAHSFFAAQLDLNPNKPGNRDVLGLIYDYLHSQPPEIQPKNDGGAWMFKIDPNF